MSSRSYSDDQAAAIAAAVLDRGMSQKAARDAAARGALDGLEPFTLSLATTQRVVSHERMKRLQAEPFDLRSAKLATRALAVAEREMTRIERLPKLTGKDHSALDRLGRLAAALRSKPWRHKSADHVIEEGRNNNGLVAKLARDMAENLAPKPDPEPPRTSTPTKTAPPAWIHNLLPKPAPDPGVVKALEILAEAQRETGRERATGSLAAEQPRPSPESREIFTGPRSSAAQRVYRPDAR
jgi:hypothetical protein